MMELATILVYMLLNALVIRGLWRAASGTQESPMLLDGVRSWVEFNLGKFLAKPIISCPACMASVHGTWFYWLVFAPGLSWWSLGLWLLWVPAVSTITEYIHERI